MYSLYQIDAKNFNLIKIEEGTIGNLKVKMNSLKNTNKGNLYAIYCGNTLCTSMVNK